MPEQQIKIPVSDSELSIYGVLRGSFDDPLIILCHGYGGWMHEMLLYNAARYFEKQGYASLRLSMYGGGENSRNIGESDVMTHASDIDDVTEFARNAGSQQIGIVGHSYSGLAIVYSKQQNFDAAALWDPTHTDGYDTPETISNLEEDFLYIDNLKSYVSSKGPGYVYAKTVFNNDYPKSEETSKNFKVPTCVINASWSKDQQRYGKNYAESINAETQQIVIPDSTHPFVEDGAAEKLFQVTYEFFKHRLK